MDLLNLFTEITETQKAMNTNQCINIIRLIGHGGYGLAYEIYIFGKNHKTK